MDSSAPSFYKTTLQPVRPDTFHHIRFQAGRLKKRRGISLLCRLLSGILKPDRTAVPIAMSSRR